MHIIVLIKQVPLTADVAIDPKTGVIQRETGETKLNPYDLYALEAALRLKTQYGANISVLTMGPPQAEAVVREAFAMGVDEGFLLTDRAFAGSDVLATAYALSQGLRTLESFDLIICGKQTTDGDTAQVGPEISEFLGVPCLTAVQQILDVQESMLTVVSDTGASLITATVDLPALIAVDKDIYQPRLPSYLRMKQTQQKHIHHITLNDLEDTNTAHYGLDGSPTQVIKIFPPASNPNFEIWNQGNLADQLYQFLKNEKFLQEIS
ncbi:MAG: electron transfer flavoprotein subunit beta/FixA family protein [Sphaerochaetaceae bacterium]|jgi:electron transfer flavoprotein beta subunit|nr:electron transfer flavoprotein subunit beta/FixA family protein [Sphaerochaetaceae bacterium]MDY0370805.1 electron transfer flavoprotein subunit beta/FixA family protein [Sphaerochaetaceae bacterium]